MSPPSSWSKNKPKKKPALKQVESRALLAEKSGPHGVISQIIENFITTAVRTLNPTTKDYLLIRIRFDPMTFLKLSRLNYQLNLTALHCKIRFTMHVL
jgi:hypothetical protein